MDPIVSNLLAGAAGGAGGKAVETIVDMASKSIRKLFQEQEPAIHAQSTTRMIQLITALESECDRLIATSQVTLDVIESTISQPSAAMLVQSALYNGIKTSRHDKHALLARLVIERLTSNEETLLSVASDLACQAITAATPRQLRMLGMRSTLDRLEPNSIPTLQYPDEARLSPLEWVLSLMEPYMPLQFHPLDVKQLQAIACIGGRTGHLAYELPVFVTSRYRLQFTMEQFYAAPVGAFTKHVWDAGLSSAELTSIGFLIGIFVSDALRQTTTDLSQWKQP